MNEDEVLFKVRMSKGSKTAYLELESKEVITYGILIDALIDLADQLSKDENSTDDRH